MPLTTRGNHPGLRKTAEPEKVARIAENWLAFAGIFFVLEVHSLRKGSPTLSSTVRMFPRAFVVFWVWMFGHIIFGWKVPGEEKLCRLLKTASVRAAAEADGVE